MMRIIALIFILLHSMVFGQTTFENAERNATSAKANNLDELHRTLTTDLQTDAEKIRAFYFWIANNINYDVNEWINRTNNWSKQDPANVLKSKRAVCHGYSALFQDLCNRSEIKNHLVSGYTKKNNIFNNEGHTWNVVFVNDAWRLVDATWGAGGVTSDRKFVKQFDEKYFMPEPEDFLTEHYPFDPMWQLVFFPVKLSDYKKANWSFSENVSANKFYYSDTISNWMLNDSINRQVFSAQRMVRFNPDDKLAKEELSNAMFNAGDAELQKGNLIMAELYPKTGRDQTTAVRKNISKEEFNAQLDLSLLHYQKADSIYKKTVVYSAAERSNLEQAMKVLKHNMSVIFEERKR